MQYTDIAQSRKSNGNQLIIKQQTTTGARMFTIIEQEQISNEIRFEAQKTDMSKFAKAIIKNVSPDTSKVIDLYEKMQLFSGWGFYDDYEKAETELLGILTNVWEKHNGTRPETDN